MSARPQFPDLASQRDIDRAEHADAGIRLAVVGGKFAMFIAVVVVLVAFIASNGA